MSLRALKLAAVVAMSSFLVSAAYISMLMDEQQSALKGISRYSSAWETSQAVSEFLRLEQRLTEFDDPDSSVDREEVELRYDIAVSRAAALEQGGVKDLIRHLPDQQLTLQLFKESLAAAQPFIEELDHPSSARKALEVLKPLEGRLAALASLAHGQGTELVQQDQQQLIRLHWTFSGVAAGLILLGLVLVALLARHIRLLAQAREELHALAHYDALTGLANRVLFQERLDEALARLTLANGMIAVLYLDLDGFKGVNDTFGHKIGDALLAVVAGRLRNCIREADTVARLGGDEFTVLQARVDGPQDCSALAVRILAAVGAPYRIEGRELNIGVSIGISLAREGTRTVEQLLDEADEALYRAKASGRGTFQFFTPTMKAQSARGQGTDFSEKSDIITA
jgi:diguanylate cyclase (GGDEF)-like protein